MKKLQEYIQIQHFKGFYLNNFVEKIPKKWYNNSNEKIVEVGNYEH
jgi:hypothetical protein